MDIYMLYICVYNEYKFNLSYTFFKKIVKRLLQIWFLFHVMHCALLNQMFV